MNFISNENIQLLCSALKKSNIDSSLKKNDMFKDSIQDYYKNHLPHDYLEKSISDLNKLFLIYYVKTTRNDFLVDISENIKAEEKDPLVFSDKKEIPITIEETEKELGLRMKERESEISLILSSQTPVKLEPITTSIKEENKLKVETKIQEFQEKSIIQYEETKRRVSFQEEEIITDTSNKMDDIFLEMVKINQEISEIKKMFGMIIHLLKDIKQTV